MFLQNGYKEDEIIRILYKQQNGCREKGEIGWKSYDLIHFYGSASANVGRVLLKRSYSDYFQSPYEGEADVEIHER